MTQKIQIRFVRNAAGYVNGTTFEVDAVTPQLRALIDQGSVVASVPTVAALASLGSDPPKAQQKSK